MKSTAKQTVTIILGWVFIVVGVAGLFLPIVQGIWFLAIGFGILSKESPWARRVLDRFFVRFPSLRKKFNAIKEKQNNLLQKILGRKAK